MKFISLFMFTTMVAGYAAFGFEARAADLIKPLRFGDAKRVPFKGGSPHAYPVHGVDVSKYQGEIDWQLLKSRGTAFAFIKATEGGDHTDEAFKTNWRNAKRAGVPRGAYHFYYFCTSAKKQAQWFIKNVPKDPSALPPVLDAEWNKKSRTCKKFPSPGKVRSEFLIFLKLLERHYGKKPIIYTTPDFYDENFKGVFHNYPMWLRSVIAHPRSRYPGRKWRFWQYTGTGRIKGFKGNIDINVYNGSMGEFNRWLRKVTNAR